MGSSGVHHFTDYTGSQKQPGGQGGASGDDRCAQPIVAALEDVDRSEYVRRNGYPPVVGTAVTVVFHVRPTVTNMEGIAIGYLPTQYNFLRGCIESGLSYAGQVTQSRIRPIATVSVALQPR